MSSLYKKNNRFYYSIYVNGRRIVKSLGLSDKSIANKIKKDLDLKYTREKFGIRNIESVRIDPYLTDFLRLISKTKGDSTYKRIKSYIKNLRLFFNGRQENNIQDIDARTVKDYILFRMSNDIAPKTIREEIDIFRRIVEEAVTDNYLEKNIIDFKMLKNRHIPKNKSISYPPFSKDQAEEIFKCPDLAKYSGYFKALYYTGMRTVDVGQLQSGEVIQIDKVPCISKITKKEDVPVTIPLHNEIKFLLKFKPDPWYFPNLITDSNRHQAYKALKEFIKTKKWIGSFCQHSFRHGFSQRLLELNMSDHARQILLGHLSSSSTKRYSHPDIALFKSFIDKM